MARAAAGGAAVVGQAGAVGGWAELRVVDAQSGRGVPLVELETVNGLRFVTDSAGRIAFQEPGLMGTEVYFHVRSHGYSLPRDGFGYSGVRVTPRVGTPVVVRVNRVMAAERLCRLTGEGRYRDTLLLGYELPRALSGRAGGVAGQDSVQAAVHRGRVYWFWGDTQRMEYPLGLFRMAGATSEARIELLSVQPAGSEPVAGIAYEYFTDPATGFARAMMPLPERPQGVVWVSAVFTAPDEKGRPRLVGHYSRRPGLEGEHEQGLAVFDDEREVFVPAKVLPLSESWRRPAGHPIAWEEGGRRWVLMGSPHPNVRVPTTLSDVLNPASYEALTCAEGDAEEAGPRLDGEGRPVWRWERGLPPTDSKMEHRWIEQGKLKAEHARFCPEAVGVAVGDKGERVRLHSGTVRWNAHRGRWVMLAGQIGGRPSFLGEVWYAEAEHPVGPFVRAVRVVTHDRQSFYNVCQHAFLDGEGGRWVHFEGTYTNDFSGNPDKTARYNYNQVLYRLDLDSPSLAPARAP